MRALVKEVGEVVAAGWAMVAAVRAAADVAAVAMVVEGMVEVAVAAVATAAG